MSCQPPVPFDEREVLGCSELGVRARYSSRSLRESPLFADAFTVVAMGFNPFRPQTRTAFDIAMVVGAIALTLAVVAWAIFAG